MSKVFVIDGAQQWRPVIDPLTTHRQESWHLDLLNLKDTSLGVLDGVTEGSFTFNSNATIRGGGSINYAGPAVDWLRHRIQPWYSLTAGGQSMEWPIGIFIPASPSTQYGIAGRAGSIELYDKTHILDQDRVEKTFVASAGTTATTLVRSIITGAGEKKIALTDSTATLRKAIAWEAGTSKLQIVNDLLDSINYFSIWCDGYGAFRADPYDSPASRMNQFGFVDDSKGIYLPDFTHTADAFDVPNKVLCIAQGDGDSPALTAVATNTDPNNPYSQPYRGRWIVRVEESVEASNQTILNGIANRFLSEGQQVGSTYQIKHAPIDLRPNDAVGFRRDSEDIDIKATVESIEYSMEPGSLCSTTIREVQS